MQLRVESQPFDAENRRMKFKFSVTDTGIGIPEESKKKIFESFSQADSSIDRRYGGTGLGLTISSSFLEMMGAKLELDSEVGEGTTFYFTLDLPVDMENHDFADGTLSMQKVPVKGN